MGQELALNKNIQTIIDNEDWNVRSFTKTNERDYVLEIEMWSEAGQNVIETICFDGTLKDLQHQAFRLAAGYDEDEEAEYLIQHRGENGIPDSVRTIIDDVEYIRQRLWDLYNKFNSFYKSGIEYVCEEEEEETKEKEEPYWISVDEAHPKNSDYDVMIVIEAKNGEMRTPVVMAYEFNKEWYWSDDDTIINDKVKYWHMPKQPPVK